MKKSIFQLILATMFLSGCNSDTIIGFNNKSSSSKNEITQLNKKKEIEFSGTEKTIHILVALCDNKYQGIVPVPKKIGNGQNPTSNLYWGAGYGIKTFFKRSKEWKLLKTKKYNGVILERLVFKHRKKNFYLVADAYDGRYIKSTVVDFLKSASGIIKDTIKIGNKTIGINGNANLIAYIGHDGLMDFDLNESFKNTDHKKRDVIILACYSKEYFSKFIKETKANPIVWSTGLMAPEAYTIHDAITGYVNGETGEQIRMKAAKAYSKYQKCSLRAAKNLLVNGWK